MVLEKPSKLFTSLMLMLISNIHLVQMLTVTCHCAAGQKTDIQLILRMLPENMVLGNVTLALQ